VNHAGIPHDGDTDRPGDVDDSGRPSELGTLRPVCASGPRETVQGSVVTASAKKRSWSSPGAARLKLFLAFWEGALDATPPTKGDLSIVNEGDIS
jgi:hypothetical protein